MKTKWFLLVLLLLLVWAAEAQKRGKGKKPTTTPTPATRTPTTTTTTTTTTTPPPRIEITEEDIDDEIQVIEQSGAARVSCPEQLRPKDNSQQPCTCFDQLFDNSVLLECAGLTSAQQLKDVFDLYLKGSSFDGLEVRNSTLGPLTTSLTGDSSISTLLMRSNEITSIDATTFEKTDQSIVRLDLSDNKLSTVDLRIFNNFTELQVLNLGGNQLTNIEGFGPCAKLRVVYLYSNQIDTIATDAFAQLPSLELLDLRFNSLRTLSPGSLHVTAARWQLRLRSNQLSSIDEVFAQGQLPFMTELVGNNIELLPSGAFGPLTEAALLEGSKIYLKGNPLNCDCPIAWLVRNSTLLQTVEGAVCEGDNTAVIDLNPADYSHCPGHQAWSSLTGRQPERRRK